MAKIHVRVKAFPVRFLITTIIRSYVWWIKLREICQEKICWGEKASGCNLQCSVPERNFGQLLKELCYLYTL